MVPSVPTSQARSEVASDSEEESEPSSQPQPSRPRREVSQVTRTYIETSASESDDDDDDNADIVKKQKTKRPPPAVSKQSTPKSQAQAAVKTKAIPIDQSSEDDNEDIVKPAPTTAKSKTISPAVQVLLGVTLLKLSHSYFGGAVGYCR